MSHTPSKYSADSSHWIGDIVYDICNNHIMNECIYARIILACKTLMVKIFHTIDGSGTAEWPYLAVARMAECQDGNLVPMAGEVRRHSSYLKKLKKLPNKYRTTYKFHAIY
jgi:hypothetical protein